MADRKKMQEFYIQRDDFLRYIKNNCEKLDSICNSDIDDFLPKKIKGNLFENDYFIKGSSYIRACYFANDKLFNELIERTEQLKKLYYETFNNKTLALYFPKFFDGIERVTISSNSAYESRNFTLDDEMLFEEEKKNKFLLVYVYENTKPNDFIDFCKANKIEYKESDFLELTSKYYVAINIFDLMRYLKDIKKINFNSMTLRAFTGTQFLIRLSKANELAQRHTYSFMIFNTRVKINRAIERKKRDDLLENKKLFYFNGWNIDFNTSNNFNKEVFLL